MTPQERYQRDLKRDDFMSDPAQQQAVQHLQTLYEQLITVPPPSLIQRLNPFASKARTPVQGLYFWGGVGRGKTYLMDTFFDCLPFPEKMRLHFHHFMRRVHSELTALEGEKNPLENVAAKLAGETRIICFDEFFVSDITDAMILGGLFEQLFQRGVTLVATSNVEPDNLYKDGLQRARFLPAIALLKTHTQVINVDGGVDYRLRLLEQAETYHFPLNEQTGERLTNAFAALAADFNHATGNKPVTIAGRDIPCKHSCEDLGWFTFEALCDGPRSQNDYIELACLFQTIILEGVPQMDASKDDQARRFINLIDEFYDRHVKLIVSAEVTLIELYADGRLGFEFQRTISRLQEMQSREYLAQPHRSAVV
ncbi:ATPase [Endozoicomonas montiporae]|uniref:Cell division protein ZapE n=2 Tax=Endozoicomonas montiporae TaxID=1027273 RepID=A0A081N4V0_9GAMM|nr:cell division protein ZapE [Endozoicomonas montiporae]AMO57654.1 cell division protein ZapE [Endozoicomonas montiporae CL-33]KEQ13473.1 ATPase [Endozoicomonas montiporae]